MANAAVDWTVDQLLSGAKSLNARDVQARTQLQANRVRYMETLRSLPSIADIPAREAARSRLTDWIHRQVGIENQYNAFSAQWAAAKAKVKGFLQSINVTPPVYLGFAPLGVPLAIWGLVAAGLALVAIIIAAAVNHGKALDNISAIVQMAAQRGWTAAETKKALDAARPASEDPTGITGALKAVLPVAVVVGAIMILGPMMRRRVAA